LAGRRYRSFRVFALLSDGELDAGIVWEAALFAAHQDLGNLTYIVDCNGLQYTGPTNDILSLHPLDLKWRAFGWDVISDIDGHDPEVLTRALLGDSAPLKPRVILANTVKGKGVSFMENSLDWHGKAPSDDEYLRARSELLNAMKVFD
jgi:transketolase